jgi:hypothetical protein
MESEIPGTTGNVGDRLESLILLRT